MKRDGSCRQRGDGAMGVWSRTRKEGRLQLRLGAHPAIRKVLMPLLRWRGRRVAPSRRIQELDGGFFEKFGSLLKEQADQEAAADERALHGGSGDGGADAGHGADVEAGEDDAAAAAAGEGDGDGEAEEGAQPPPTDSDSEPEETDKQQFISDAMGWNIEELYSEILYELLHTVGSDVTSDERDALLSYLQEAFKLDNERHSNLLERAQSKEAPNILLNVEVIEAKDLAPKDANGLCDPFCTLYLNSANTARYNTSVKSETLSPVWEEHFSLPVENPSEDILFVEVWDFDPAETVREKMMKIGEVKGVKGLRKLMKEIAVTASTGKHDNELVGSVQIPLRNIPSSGQMYWCSLERKNKGKKQGDIKIKLSFGAEKNPMVALQEHRHLLRLLLLHDLEEAKTQPYQWNGAFQEKAETILTQHVVQCGLSPADVALAQWSEFITVHIDNHLNFRLFAVVLEKLLKPIQGEIISGDNAKLFWDSTKKLLPSCLNAVRKIRKLTPSDKNTLNQLSSVLSILSLLKELQPPEGFELFPQSVYGWLNYDGDEPNCDIQETLRQAVTQGATDWYNHIMDNNKVNDSEEEAQLNHVIKIVQLVRTDLQRAIEYHDKIFQQTIHLPYAKTLYKLYESKVSELVGPVIKNACMCLKPLKFGDNMEVVEGDTDPLSMGTKLFELYLILQRFCVMGIGLCPADADDFEIKNFHLWFHRGVAQWLDIALYKALQRINKAVELDKLEPVDSTVKYSSSAVDTLAIFYQIKIFWKQLNWPDVEGSYTFVAKIIDDICKCSVYYADKMGKKVEGLGEIRNVYETKFEVTNEWCLAINNIDYVRQSIVPFVSELGMEEIITSLANFRSQTEAEHCRETLQLVIDNDVETVRNKILELLETVAEKMTPSIHRFLLEGAELLHQDSNTLDRLMKYLDDNLITLHSQLNEDNFDRILAIMWENVSHIMLDIVENNLEKRRPPSFFANLHETLNILIGFFRQGAERNTSPVLQQIDSMLKLHGMETSELIHHYHLERLEEQNAMETPHFGLLTIRAQFVEDLLRVEIMNARNLRPMDSNGSCDPYVKIHLLPEEKFGNVTKPRTKTHKKTVFPLYDETFTINLTPEQQGIKNGIVHFVVKDQDFIGANQFIGEAYIAFADVPRTDMTKGLEELEQIHLKLSRPTRFESRVLRALENRQEKLAKDFIKKQKAKIIDN
ncbi:protein unc-13 homolog 4B isoform X1 [Schistocerca americana]|uniref:protein unc-13 homolog 4B isoform X1 n=1 Tax=Schistocerca americana TaxID=7009 RepID=UPI001F4F1581|nr:protein unc-13 homolog 4B isoform X1 [Schistocerca americana]